MHKPGMMPPLVAEHLVKQYPNNPRNVIDDVSLTLESSEIVGLLGPNGAGKTTLTKLLCGIIPPTSGTVSLLGDDPVRQVLQTRSRISVVHQRTTFDMMITGWDNLKIAAKFMGLRWADVRSRVADLLELFELPDAKCRQPIFTLSGGEQRRLQVVRALLRIPKILFLDEPSTGIDVSGRRRIWSLVQDLRAQYDMTVLWTSHYTEELERNCDRIIVLNEGRIIRNATPQTLVQEFGQERLRITLADGARTAELACHLSTLGVQVTASGNEIVISSARSESLQSSVWHIMAVLQNANTPVDGFEVLSPSLEDAFLALTGAAQRATEEGVREVASDRIAS